MAVACRRCGREYDASLFAFGRTIWCTCGARVGRDLRERRLDPPEPKRFIADAMLGRLARWLRLLGFDCSYDSRITDDELVRRGVSEERIILSRDLALREEWWIPGIYLLGSERLGDQLEELLRHFELAKDVRLLSRCNACNQLLQPVDASQVAARVPPGVLEGKPGFSECPACRRVFWEGSHTARIRRVLEQLLAGA